MTWGTFDKPATNSEFNRVFVPYIDNMIGVMIADEIAVLPLRPPHLHHALSVFYFKVIQNRVIYLPLADCQYWMPHNVERVDGVVGYRICLTHRRSSVRAWVESLFYPSSAKV